MKYLLFEDPSGHLLPILFPERIDHEEMRDQMPYATVISGGFIVLDNGRFVCHGQAKALDIQARKEDATVIELHFQDER